MNELIPVAPAAPLSPLRQRLIDDMNMRHFSRETQRNYVRDVGRFATFLGHPPIPQPPKICAASRSSSAKSGCRYPP
tara:strand:- start:6627 stop:6857 length:231 start_codon:yes stop_codon:yes gene_type:complete